MSAAKFDSLQGREEHHAALLKTVGANAASRFRFHTREFCNANNLPVPAWATQQRPPGRKAKEKPAAKRAPAPSLSFTPGQPLELPRALREWRTSAEGRAISIASDGTVTLLRVQLGDKFRATFPSLQAAAEAVEPPIRWQRLDRSETQPRWAWQ